MNDKRGEDQAVRELSLKAFNEYLESGVEAGLTFLRSETDPIAISSALQLLVVERDFKTVLEYAATKQMNCKWIHLAIYANVSLSLFDDARNLLAWAITNCDIDIQKRCRIVIAEATFIELMREQLPSQLTTQGKEALLFTIDVLSPIVNVVVIEDTVSSDLYSIAIHYTVEAHGWLGSLSSISHIGRPLERTTPIPLIVGQLVLSGLYTPSSDICFRLKAEHPVSFSAYLLAAMIRRDNDESAQAAFNEVLLIGGMAKQEGEDSVNRWCQALFEMSSELDLHSLEEAKKRTSEELGAINPFTLFYDATISLKRGASNEALAFLEKDPRIDDPVWWQISSYAHEQNGDVETASDQLEKAYKLAASPLILRRFVGLNLRRQKYDKVEHILAGAVSQNRRNIELLVQYSSVLLRLRKYNEATKVIVEIVQLDPNNFAQKFNLAVCRIRLGEFQLAVDTLTDLIESKAHEPLQMLLLRNEALLALGKAKEANTCLGHFWDEYRDDPIFLHTYMETAYRADDNSSAEKAFAEIRRLAIEGKLPSGALVPATKSDLIEFVQAGQKRQRTLDGAIAAAKMPWLYADYTSHQTAFESWKNRTQPISAMREDTHFRGRYTIYATNGFSVADFNGGTAELQQIVASAPPGRIVADMSALITAYQLGMLAKSCDYFRQVVVPSSYSDILRTDTKRIMVNQASRQREVRQICLLLDSGKLRIADKPESEYAIVSEFISSKEFNNHRLSDLADLLESTQRLSTKEITELRAVSSQKEDEAVPIADGAQLLIEIETLRSISGLSWIDRLLSKMSWSITERDASSVRIELRAYEYQETTQKEYAAFSAEIHSLVKQNLIVFDDISASATDDSVEDKNPYLDAPLLAEDSQASLWVDDRVCQAIIHAKTNGKTDSAFPTAAVIHKMLLTDKLNEDDAATAMLQLLRWRYRFLVIPANLLVCYATRAKGNFPGAELREVASYIQSCMSDTGLLSGRENKNSPLSMAYKLFMAWSGEIIFFLGKMWADDSYSDAQLKTITNWTMSFLLPGVPLNMTRQAEGAQLSKLVTGYIISTSVACFGVHKSIERANLALRLIAEALGVSDDEYHLAVARAVGTNRKG